VIIVTGGAGLVGSNIISALNDRGIRDILVIDHLKNGRKMTNLADLNFVDYMDRDDFLARLRSNHSFGNIDAVFHQGACSATTEWDGKFMMRNNFEYSKELLHFCQKVKAQFLYASSASVYGMADKGFSESRDCENPINMYAFSKFQFDQYVRSLNNSLSQQVVGLRYFNVYGPRESHKGPMASTPFHFNNQLKTDGVARLFSRIDNNDNGTQERDFIFVGDCVAVNLWFFENPNISGIFNLGTGVSRTFNDVANAVIDWHGYGKIEYIPFPEHLKGSYQNFTRADIEKLRAVGYDAPFQTIEQGIFKYLNWLNS
jgi:ADP-L-glycero-D-manno-heptose 6-epimerase